MPKDVFVRIIGLMMLLLSANLIFGQQAFIRIIDAKTKEPVQFASVCFQGLKTVALQQAVSDRDGKVTNNCKERSKLAVTYVGYETLTDTVEPGATVTLMLVPAVLNMSEFVVTAQFKPEKADKSIYKINVINSRQIERKAATNLSDLLKTESNVRISQSGVMGANLSFMGLSGENVKILLDGVPVIGRLDGNIDINQLNLYNVDHVEIIEGPMSVIYGSNAIGGVVNIITKENKSSPLTAFANAYYESVGQYNFSLGSSLHNRNNTLSVDLSRNFFDGFSGSEQSRQMTWDPKQQYNANAYYLYSTNKIRVKLSMQYFDELIQSKGELIGPYYEKAIDKYFHTVRQTSKAEASYTFSPRKQLSFVGAFSTYNRKQEIYLNDLTVLEKVIAGGDTTNLISYYLRSMYESFYFENKLKTQLGIEGSYDVTEGARILGLAQEIGDFAGFLNASFSPDPKFTIQPGARLIYNTKYAAPVVYSINAKYAFSSHSSLRATFARGFRSPSIKELYLDFVDINHDLHGNPDLKAESSYNTNLNFTYNRETTRSYINTELSLFYNNVDNMIEMLQVGNSIKTYTYGNVLKFISQGVEANASVNFYPRFTIKGGVSYIGRKFPLKGVEGAGDKFYYSTDYNLALTYNIEKYNASFTTNLKITSKYPQLSPDATFNNDYIEGYPSLDVILVKNFFQSRLAVSVGGKNLFDVTNVEAGMGGSGAHSASNGASVIAWGRTVFVRLTYNYRKH